MNAEQAVLEAFERGKAFGFAEGMKSMKTDMNKPVAWMDENENVWTSCVACGQRVTGDSIHTCSPQLKQLTDEEISQIAKESYVWNVGKQEWSEIDFAKAILRKAQEK